MSICCCTDVLAPVPQHHLSSGAPASRRKAPDAVVRNSRLQLVKQLNQLKNSFLLKALEIKLRAIGRTLFVARCPIGWEMCFNQLMGLAACK